MSIDFNTNEPMWREYKSYKPDHRSLPIANISMIGVEDTLVEFITRLVEPWRLDTEGMNLIPETPMDDEAREQAIEGKVRPSVFAGYIPLTVTGEVVPDAVVKIPSVTVQGTEAYYNWDNSKLGQSSFGIVKILVSVWAQTQNKQGYRDAVNLTEMIVRELWQALVINGTASVTGKSNIQGGLGLAPISWKNIPSDELNVFYTMITYYCDLITPTPDLHQGTQEPWIAKPPEPTPSRIRSPRPANT